MTPLDRLAAMMSTKDRFIRTPAGAAHFGGRIGDRIDAHGNVIPRRPEPRVKKAAFKKKLTAKKLEIPAPEAVVPRVTMSRRVAMSRKAAQKAAREQAQQDLRRQAIAKKANDHPRLVKAAVKRVVPRVAAKKVFPRFIDPNPAVIRRSPGETEAARIARQDAEDAAAAIKEDEIEARFQAWRTRRAARIKRARAEEKADAKAPVIVIKTDADRKKILDDAHKLAIEYAGLWDAVKADQKHDYVEDDYEDDPTDEIKLFRARYRLSSLVSRNYDDETPLSNAVATGDWVRFGPCRQMRLAAYKLLTQKPHTADFRVKERHVGNQIKVSQKLAQQSAAILLEGIRTAKPNTQPLYRGVHLTGQDEHNKFIAAMQAGGDIDLPLVSAVGNKSIAARFGTDATFVIKPGAHSVQGCNMGNIYLQVNHESYEKDAEQVTGGRFRIVKVQTVKKKAPVRNAFRFAGDDPNAKVTDSYVITLEQIGVFNVGTGKLDLHSETKTADTSLDLVPFEFDYLFDRPEDMDMMNQIGSKMFSSEISQLAEMSTKVRRIRSAAGEDEFHGHLGDIIKPGVIDQPKIKPNHTLVKINSHRARTKVQNIVGKPTTSWFHWDREGDWHEIPNAHLPTVMKIPGVSKAGNVTGLQKHWRQKENSTSPGKRVANRATAKKLSTSPTARKLSPSFHEAARAAQGAYADNQNRALAAGFVKPTGSEDTRVGQRVWANNRMGQIARVSRNGGLYISFDDSPNRLGEGKPSGSGDSEGFYRSDVLVLPPQSGLHKDRAGRQLTEGDQVAVGTGNTPWTVWHRNYDGTIDVQSPTGRTQWNIDPASTRSTSRVAKKIAEAHAALDDYAAARTSSPDFLKPEAVRRARIAAGMSPTEPNYEKRNDAHARAMRSLAADVQKLRATKKVSTPRVAKAVKKVSTPKKVAAAVVDEESDYAYSTDKHLAQLLTYIKDPKEIAAIRREIADRANYKGYGMMMDHNIAWANNLSTKKRGERRVETEAGARLFNQPIGSIIVPGNPHHSAAARRWLSRADARDAADAAAARKAPSRRGTSKKASVGTRTAKAAAKKASAPKKIAPSPPAAARSRAPIPAKEIPAADHQNMTKMTAAQLAALEKTSTDKGTLRDIKRERQRRLDKKQARKKAPTPKRTVVPQVAARVSRPRKTPKSTTAAPVKQPAATTPAQAVAKVATAPVKAKRAPKASAAASRVAQNAKKTPKNTKTIAQLTGPGSKPSDAMGIPKAKDANPPKNNLELVRDVTPADTKRMIKPIEGPGEDADRKRLDAIHMHPAKWPDDYGKFSKDADGNVVFTPKYYSGVAISPNFKNVMVAHNPDYYCQIRAINTTQIPDGPIDPATGKSDRTSFRDGATSAQQTGSPAYTAYKNRLKEAKSDDVRDVVGPKLRAHHTDAVLAQDDTAAAVHIMLDWGIRVDSTPEEGEKIETLKGHLAYGATSIKRDHVSFGVDENGKPCVRLEFPGKSNKINTRISTDPKMIKMFKTRIGRMKTNGPLFDTDSHKTITHIRTVGGNPKTTNKTLRSQYAGLVAAKKLAEFKKSKRMPTNEAEYKVMEKEMCEAVADALNNTWTVARSGYVGPSYFEKLREGVK